MRVLDVGYGLLFGGALAVFFIVSAFAVWMFVVTEVKDGAHWRLRALWMYGGVVIAVAVGTVAMYVLVGLGRWLGGS